MRRYSATIVGSFEEAEKMLRDLGASIIEKSESQGTLSFRADDNTLQHVQVLPCVDSCRAES